MGSEMCIRDRYISYNRYYSVPKSFFCCCSGRHSCMLTSRCMLLWLRSAPYPALCRREPLRPVGDTQAVSYGARSRQYSPLLPGSRPPARNLNLSPSDHAQGPCVGFIYIQLSKLFKNGPGMPKNDLGRFAPSALPHYKHTLPRLARSTLNELQQNQHEEASLVCVRVQSPSGLALVPYALRMVDLSGQ